MKIDDTIKEYFRQGVKLFYDTHKTRTMKETFGQTLILFFHQGMELRNGTMVPIFPPAEELPTLAQFRYWYRKEHDLKQPAITHKSGHTYQKGKRAEPDNPNLEVLGPGSVYEIVAIVVDIHMVSALDHRRIIGRPITYLIIDVFSQLIVGMSVGLEGPSGLDAMLALENMAQDKVVFCKEYGIEITGDEWPNGHLPQAIYTTQEELLSKYADNLTTELNIQVTNTIPYRSGWKVYFEQRFRTLADMSIRWRPGSVYNLHKPDRKDNRLNACLTLYDFRRLLISYILEYNKGHRLNYDHFDQAMLENKVEPYPCDIWKWGIQNRSGALYKKPIDVIRRNLLLKDHALVTQRGIQFNHLHYTCDLAIHDQWFEQRHNEKGRWEIPIAYDPQTSAYIYLCDVNGTHIKRCSLIEEEKVRFASCSWFDVEDHYFAKHEQQKTTITGVHQRKVESYALQDRIIEKAKIKEGEE